MTKIMLVEDDQSLREIYSIRLTAEGYEIVVAGDGEEALATAVKEKPDLIIADVMMPKISGFDMLDILRSTPETKDVKVIMMTALSSEDQRQRGENLGADRYLVKSQVGIEDVINVVHEVLGDKGAVAPADNSNTAGATVTQPAQAEQPVAMETAPVAQPVAEQPSVAPTPAEPAVAQPVTPAQPTPQAAPVASAQEQMDQLLSGNN
ncbi:response regulator [Candidatus Saccharibacteria bacterium]|nr:response regulator [Candidatus Saccharibacteria bacterium]